MINLIDFRDVNGAIVQRDMDGGDSAYRHALYICLLVFAGHMGQAKFEYQIFKKNCHVGHGILRRHWNKSKWYSNPNNFSRDQWQKVFQCAIMMKDYKLIAQMLFQQILRLGFHQNIHKGTDCKGLSCYKIPDLIGVSQIEMMTRLLWLPITAVLIFNYGLIGIIYFIAWLHFVDLSFLVRIYLRQKDSWDKDSLLCIELMRASMYLPSLTACYAVILYRKTDYKEKINNNYCVTTNDICPLGVYYNQISHKIFYQLK